MKKIIKYLILIMICTFTLTNVNAAALKSEENKDISSGLKIVYMGREDCMFCQLFVPSLNYFSEKYNFDYIYVDTNNVTESQLNAWFEKLEVESEGFGTPTTVITKDGKVIDKIGGYVPEIVLFETLQKNGFIDENEHYVSQYENINFIDFNGYKSIVESDKKEVLVIGQSTCTACSSAKPYINEVAKKLNIKINYFDLEFNSQEEYDYFYFSYDYIKKQIDYNSLSTPTFLVVNGKELIAKSVGYEDKQILENFIDKYYINDEKQGADKNLVLKIVVISISGVLFLLMLGYTVKTQFEYNRLEEEKKKNEKVKKEVKVVESNKKTNSNKNKELKKEDEVIVKKTTKKTENKPKKESTEKITKQEIKEPVKKTTKKTTTKTTNKATKVAKTTTKSKPTNKKTTTKKTTKKELKK